MSFTGYWKLNRQRTGSQTDLLKRMGRAAYERWAIDKADEDFRLQHYVKEGKDKHGNTKRLHIFRKDVTIYLFPSIVRLMKIVYPSISLNRVSYTHVLKCNRKPKEHKDDEKGFGPCSSRCSWDDAKQTFTIRWEIKGRGILKVDHWVEPAADQLHARLTMNDGRGVPAVSVKVYDRQAPDATTRAIQAEAHALWNLA